MMNNHIGYLLALLLVGCSAPDYANDGNASKQPAGNQSSAATNLIPNQPAFQLVAMNALNDCVSGKVTTLVNAENGNVGDESTDDIATQAVSSCDGLIDAAVNEHLSNLKATTEMPANDPASVKLVENIESELDSRSFAEWRKFHTDTKIGFAKTYVRIVANRFKPQSDQDQSGRAAN